MRIKKRFGVSTPTLESWQLGTGYYTPAKIAPTITHPRPDAETLSYERHRLAPAGIPWRIPIAVQGGGWPFKYEVVTGPTGMSIGQNYGDDNYGTLYWRSPVIGNHPVIVKVSTQDKNRTSGSADPVGEVSVTFTLSVVDKNDTTKFVWTDAVNGNDSTGTGSYTAPFKTVIGGWATKSNLAGTQAHYRAGTYTIHGPTNGSTLTPNVNQPHIHVGTYGETVTFEQGNSVGGQFEILYSGFYVGGITFNGSSGTGDWRSLISYTDKQDRVTVFENTFQNIDCHNSNQNFGNSGGFAMFATSPGRSYITVVGNTYSNIYNLLNGGGTTLYSCKYIVFENNTISGIQCVDGSRGHGLIAKGRNANVTMRNNRHPNANSYFTGYCFLLYNGEDGGLSSGWNSGNSEACWNLAVGGDVTVADNSDPVWIGNCYNYRNTATAGITAQSPSNGYLTYVERNVSVSASGAVYAGDGTDLGGGIGETTANQATTIDYTGRLLNSYIATHGLVRGQLGFEVGSSTLDGPAELPLVTVDTTYSLPTGTDWPCSTSLDFATALANCALNDTITLQAGNTFVGPFTLPKKIAGGGWIYIRSSAHASLPAAGTRVSPSDAANMPIITTQYTNDNCVMTATGAHHYRFVGIEMKPGNNVFTYALMAIGHSDTYPETTAETQSHHIVLDRCYIHGNDNQNGPVRAIAVNGNYLAVVDSYIDNVKRLADEGQGICGWTGGGPLKIHNNYIEASGINFLIGGSGIAVANQLFSDITFTNNTLSKRLSWYGTYSFKNLFEFKQANRALVENNIMENAPIGDSGQFFAVVFKSAFDYISHGAWTQTRDVTFRYNKVTNVHAAINIAGVQSGDGNLPIELTNVSVHDNLFVGETDPPYANHPVIQHVDGGDNVRIHHNTFVFSNSPTSFCTLDSTITISGFSVKDNIGQIGSYGLFASGYGEGNAALAAPFFSDPTFSYNVLYGDSSQSTYFTGLNCSFPATVSAVGFTNAAGGDYSLSGSSSYKNSASDGLDPGCNTTLLPA